MVVGGLYRFVRNPMYVAVASIIGGQALLFRSTGTAIWLLLFMAAVFAFVRAYEEPSLAEQFGDAYADYRDAVPAGGRGSRRTPPPCEWTAGRGEAATRVMRMSRVRTELRSPTT